jgi:hypothetical protein
MRGAKSVVLAVEDVQASIDSIGGAGSLSRAIAIDLQTQLLETPYEHCIR